MTWYDWTPADSEIMVDCDKCGEAPARFWVTVGRWLCGYCYHNFGRAMRQ